MQYYWPGKRGCVVITDLMADLTETSPRTVLLLIRLLGKPLFIAPITYVYLN